MTGPVLLPGVFSPLVAKMAERLGFRAIYLSGGALSAGSGLPDIGLLTLSEFVAEAQRITQICPLPLVSDADTGFGEALNVERTVRLLESAGVAGIHLEDQTLPKRCGHLSGKSLIPAEEMAGKIRAAVANAMERRSINVAIRSNNLQLDALQQELENQRLQEEIVRSRGDIYASIIHDINGPLTIISGFIQVINRRIGDTHQVEGESLDLVKDRLSRITRQVTNCIDISRRYLSFLRQDPMERSKVGVNQILADLGELLRVHPSVAKNQLTVHQLPEDVTVEINGTDLIQILLNLTINALQSVAEPHEVSITGAFQRQPLNLDLMRDGPRDRVINRDGFKNSDQLLVLAVRDDGPGIPEEVLARLFEPYFTTKAEGQGTGLGLTIVKRLVSEAGGLLHLNSWPGGGTSFSFYLPATPRV